MPLIPFPDVPVTSGVPSLPRAATASPIVSITLGTIGSILSTALQAPPQWGIFDSSNNQLGVSSSTPGGFGARLLSAAEDYLLGPGPVLSTYHFNYRKETRISDFPVERGGFASYNKIEMPGLSKVTLILDGSVDDRKAFLAELDDACKSTDLYSVVTPEATYTDCSIEDYDYDRSAVRGANTFPVEISLKEIRPVSVTYTTATTPINNPQSSDAAAQTDNGMVQSPTSTPSTLKSLTNTLSAAAGGH